MTTLLLAGVAALAFMLRCLPRFKSTGAIPSDTQFHLLLARAIREHGHRVPPSLSQVMPKSKLTYPYFFHWLLSFIPESVILKIEPLVSAALDTLHVLLAFAFTSVLLSVTGVPLDGDTVALLVAFSIAVAPGFLRISAGPRAYNTTPRTFGQLLFFAYLTSVTLASLTGNPAWLVPAAAAAAFVFLGSKFSAQMLLFSSCMMLLAVRFLPIAVVAAGFGLACLLSKGRSLSIARGHIQHSSFYARYLQQKYIWRPNRVREYWRSWFQALRRPRLGLGWFFLENFPLHILLFSFPHVSVVAVLMLFRGADLWQQPYFPQFFLALAPWVGASLALMGLTSLKHFLFLGEAERYLEYTLAPQLILCTAIVLLTGYFWILAALALYSLAAYCIYYRLYVRQSHHVAELQRKLLPLLQNIDRPGIRIFGVGHFFWAILYATRHAQVFCPQSGNVDLRCTPLDEWNLLFGNYPFPGGPLSQIIDSYRIDFIVTDEASMVRYTELVNDLSFSNGTLHEIATESPFKIFSPRCAA